LSENGSHNGHANEMAHGYLGPTASGHSSSHPISGHKNDRGAPPLTA
jgi:hypothetical protein